MNFYTHAFAEPGAGNLIDVINPNTGKSSVYGETLDQIRKRYPTAEIVEIDAWEIAKGAKQDQPVQWKDTTEERYFEMLNCLPPAAMFSGYFLVGEPWDHHAVSGRPRYAAFGHIHGRYVEASRPMTIAELKALVGV